MISLQSLSITRINPTVDTTIPHRPTRHTAHGSFGRDLFGSHRTKQLFVYIPHIEYT